MLVSAVELSIALKSQTFPDAMVKLRSVRGCEHTNSRVP